MYIFHYILFQILTTGHVQKTVLKDTAPITILVLSAKPDIGAEPVTMYVQKTVQAAVMWTLTTNLHVRIVRWGL